jgi:alkylation response protein AidB-like acyl-CoA dehydrogenase
MGLNSMSLLQWGTEEQKQRFLVPQAEGERYAAFGLTEAGAGSDVAAMRSTARLDGDDYVINGEKMWISLATKAHHVLWFAKTDPDADPPHEGITAFMVETDSAKRRV